MIDLTPAAGRVGDLVVGVDDRQLGDPTPCPDMTVGDLVDHIGTLALAFASKAGGGGATSGPPPPPDGQNLEPGWRDRIARDVQALAAVWREPSAWEGMTTAGGIELPSEVAGAIALDELVVHGWDLAMATGQPFIASDEDIAAATQLVTNFQAPRDGRLFGPVVEVADDAPTLDRLLGLAGRDPGWHP
jgi:uncharacterized protein (TIGR03086 family)